MAPSAHADPAPVHGSLAEQVLVSCPVLLTAKALCVAFSGGLDSTVLLHLLWQLRQSGKLTADLRAIHVHHGLQSAADEWSAHCRQICAYWQLPVAECRVQVETGRGQSPEEAARTARYRAFAEALGPDEFLVLAHHRDDQAETLLLRLMRGSGADGLGGMPAERAMADSHLLRPLLAFGRESLLGHAQAHGLEWVEDPSNEDDRYDRNFLRNQILPALAQRWPRAATSIARSATLMQEAAGLLDALAEIDLATANTPFPNRLQVTPLQALETARQRNLLRVWLMQQPVELATVPTWQLLQRCVDELLPAAGADHRMLQWGEGNAERELHRYRDQFFLLRPLPADMPAELAWESPSQPLALPQPFGTLCWPDAAAAGWRLTVRFRRGGERIAKADGHHQSFKDFCQQRGIPPWLRHAVPLLYRGEELVAIGDELLRVILPASQPENTGLLSWKRPHLLCGW